MINMVWTVKTQAYGKKVHVYASNGLGETTIGHMISPPNEIGEGIIYGYML